MNEGNDPTPPIGCDDIHRLLSRLPILTAPSDELPKDGLYFFYEEGETICHDGSPRIVRVGNHPRSRGRLLARLRQHYSGNKNSSVFRRYLGGAILRRRDSNHPCLQPSSGKGHWEMQNQKPCQACRPIEGEVSSLLREHFAFRIVMIEDMRLRNLMEGKLIGILSSCTDCLPSSGWTGQFAYSKKVQSSGMWNSAHVGEKGRITSHEWTSLVGAVDDTLAELDEDDIAALLGFSWFHDFDEFPWFL